MENDKLLGSIFCQFGGYQFQKFIVRRVVTAISCIFFNEIAYIGFFSKEIDERMVIALIGKESSPVARFLKCCDNSFLPIDGIEVVRRNRRHQHRDTFVRSIGFCQYMREGCQSFYFGKFRIRIAVIPVNRPVSGTGCLSDYHNINFPILLRTGGFCLKSKIIRGFRIVLRLCSTLEGKCNIITYVCRIQIRFQFITGIKQISSYQ